jgi:heme-degrading monooxygenase HmoA
MQLATTPPPPYYAVIFTSLRRERPGDGYEPTAARMFELARRQPGFLGVDTARAEIGITVSYWRDEESIARWKRDEEHRLAQQQGRDRWYESFEVRVARVERTYSFTRGRG